MLCSSMPSPWMTRIAGFSTLKPRALTVLPKQAAPLYLVRIDVEGEEGGRGELRGRIKLGMAGQVEVITDRESLLSVLVRTVRQTISLD